MTNMRKVIEALPNSARRPPTASPVPALLLFPPPTTMMSRVDLLVLGAGWTSTFLLPLCAARGISAAATTRSGRDGTLAFAFDPASDDPAPFRALPNARTVLVTFPIYVPGASARLVRLYRETHADGDSAAFVQLGSTGIWDVSFRFRFRLRLRVGPRGRRTCGLGRPCWELTRGRRVGRR